MWKNKTKGLLWFPLFFLLPHTSQLPVQGFLPALGMDLEPARGISFGDLKHSREIIVDNTVFVFPHY